MQLINVSAFNNKVLINQNFIDKYKIANLSTTTLVVNGSLSLQNEESFFFFNLTQFYPPDQPTADIIFPIEQFLNLSRGMLGKILIVGQQDRLKLYSLQDNAKNIQVSQNAYYIPEFLVSIQTLGTVNRVQNFFYSYGTNQFANNIGLLILSIPVFIIIIFFGYLIIVKLEKEFLKSAYLLKPRGLDERTLGNSFFLYGIVLSTIGSITVSILSIIVQSEIISIMFNSTYYFDVEQAIILLLTSYVLSLLLTYITFHYGLERTLHLNVKQVQSEKVKRSSSNYLYLIILIISLVGITISTLISQKILLGSTKIVAISFYYTIISSLLYIFVPFGLIIGTAFLLFTNRAKIDKILSKMFRRQLKIPVISAISDKMGIFFIVLFSFQLFLLLFVSQTPNITYVSYLNEHGAPFETYYSNENDFNQTKIIQDLVLKSDAKITESWVIAKSRIIFTDSQSNIPIELYLVNISEIPKLAGISNQALNILQEAEQDKKGVLLDYSPTTPVELTFTTFNNVSIQIGLEKNKISIPGFNNEITNDLPGGYPLLKSNIQSIGLLLPTSFELNYTNIPLLYKIRFYTNNQLPVDNWLQKYKIINNAIDAYYSNAQLSPNQSYRLELIYLQVDPSIGSFQLVLIYEMLAIILISICMVSIYYYIDLKDSEKYIGLLLSKGYSRTKIRLNSLSENVLLLLITVLISLILGFIVTTWLSQFSSYNAIIVVPDIPSIFYVLFLAEFLTFAILLYVILKIVVSNKRISSFLNKFD